MGIKIVKRAEKLGLLSRPMTVLNGQPGRRVELGGVIKKYMKEIDSKVKEKRVTFKDSKLSLIVPLKLQALSYQAYSHFFLSMEHETFIDYHIDYVDFPAMDVNNHVFSLCFYTENQDIIREVANRIYHTWNDGIFQHIKWHKMAKLDLYQEDVVNGWSKWVDFDISDLIVGRKPVFVCINCRGEYPIASIKKTTEDMVECPKCKKMWYDTIEHLLELHKEKEKARIKKFHETYPHLIKNSEDKQNSLTN
jgi:hypothetical protein